MCILSEHREGWERRTTHRQSHLHLQPPSPLEVHSLETEQAELWMCAWKRRQCVPQSQAVPAFNLTNLSVTLCGGKSKTRQQIQQGNSPCPLSAASITARTILQVCLSPRPLQLASMEVAPALFLFHKDLNLKTILSPASSETE